MTPSEDQIEAYFFKFASEHMRSVLKASLIGIMVFFSVCAFTGSVWKAFVVGTLCLAISMFNTWRRYLEVAGFFVFCFAVVHWCAPEVWQFVRFPALAQLHAH
jgi:hypothetical protein